MKQQNEGTGIVITRQEGSGIADGIGGAIGREGIGGAIAQEGIGVA